jgi:hypothetical protein
LLDFLLLLWYKVSGKVLGKNRVVRLRGIQGGGTWTILTLFRVFPLGRGNEGIEMTVRVKRFEQSEARMWKRWLDHCGISDPNILKPEEETALREKLQRENSRICATPGYRTRSIGSVFSASTASSL